MRASHACLALLATAPWAAVAQPVAGYDVERSQTVQTAPPGSVGRKTTDRQHLIGTAEDTLGSELTHVLTFGGFARQCPSSAGYVDGEFEYSIAYDSVEAGDDGVTRRERHVRRLVAQLKGEVDDQAHLKQVELVGTFTIDRTGDDVAPQAESRPVRTTFTPGAVGQPDIPAMEVAVRMTADIAVASVILTAGLIYRDAEAHWRKPNECVELTFDPPTDTISMKPNEERQVRATLTAKADGSVVRWTSDNINAIEAIGTVAPTHVQDATAAAVAFTYTAAARPRKGHGIAIEADSRAGIALATWRITDRYEGTFSQVDTTEGGVAIYNTSGREALTGRLVFTPDNSGRASPSFGNVPSSFYRATEGEITIETSQNNTGLAGSNCEGQAQKTFALGELPPSKLEHLQLEIAADGRYKLTLAILDYPQTTWETEVTCNFPGVGRRTQTVTAMLPAVMIGIREGSLDSERAIVGEMVPEQRGPRRTTGNWHFKLAE